MPRLFHLKRALQKKGTKSAKRHLKRVRHKQARFRRSNDHVLSKQIMAAIEPGGTIVLENLTGIRKRTKIRKQTETSRRVHSWSFAQASVARRDAGGLPVNQPIVSNQESRLLIEAQAAGR